MSLTYKNTFGVPSQRVIIFDKNNKAVGYTNSQNEADKICQINSDFTWEYLYNLTSVEVEKLKQMVVFKNAIII
tara:strand:- start:360 stop:581 length:222 start_codon:yes stop_codon:yes gene_type:complete